MYTNSTCRDQTCDLLSSLDGFIWIAHFDKTNFDFNDRRRHDIQTSVCLHQKIVSKSKSRSRTDLGVKMLSLLQK